LTGTIPIETMTRTIEEMKRMGPHGVVPTHGTGWKAMNMFKGKYFLGIMGSFYGCTALAFQLGQNKQPSKMAREVVLMDEDSWGC